jgi:hypothetical protein
MGPSAAVRDYAGSAAEEEQALSTPSDGYQKAHEFNGL